MDGEYISSGDAAKQLGVSIQTVRRWAERKLIPAKRQDGMWLVDVATIPRELIDKAKQHPRYSHGATGADNCTEHRRRIAWLEEQIAAKDRVITELLARIP